MSKNGLMNVGKNVFYQVLSIIVLSLPVIAMNLFMRTILCLQRIKLFLGKQTDTRVSLYHGGKMFEIENLSTDEQKDFKRFRSLTYIKQLTFGSLWEFSKFVSGQQKVPLIEDDMIYEVIMNSVFCHGLKREDKDPSISWRLPFNLREYRVFDGFYWDVKEILIHKDKSVSIIDRAGNIHTPTSPKWILAKAHAQAQLTFFAPGLAHNHVHFVFPSLVAAYVRSKLPQSSVLRQLLEPHTRFTQYINYKALNECQSSSNTGSFIDRWFRPWLSFPINNDDFLNGIKQNCELFYYDNLTLTQDLHQDLPYHKFLKDYYPVIRKFVERLEPLIRDDCETLSSAISNYLPAINHHDETEIITTLIWNCAVVHYCDHQTYLKYFAKKYGCMSVRIPLVTESTVVEEKNKYEQLSIENDSCSLFLSEDIYRTRCFLNTFVQFNDDFEMDHTLPKTKYDFSEVEAIEASAKFFDDLKYLDQKLHRSNKDIIPLDTMVRTVCF